jgi:hypothetical protein
VCGLSVDLADSAFS